MSGLTVVKYSIFTLLLLFSKLFAEAQLKAEFSSDKTGGCAPLIVSFTNQSTGASASATYEWSFGNGNSSILKSPGTIFEKEQAYTVTLTVKDGGQQSS